MSFCLVSTFYPPASFGGDAIHVRSLARGLASRGHQVRVIHSPEAHRLLGGTSTDGASPPDSDVEVVAVPVGRTATAATVGTYLTGLPLGYKRRLHELTQGFDVVHFHNPSLLGGPGGLTAGSAQALRLYTAMEHWLLCPTHALFRFGREVCTKATCWRCTLSYRRPPQLWRSTRLLETMVDQLDTVITLSRFTAKLHQDAFATCHVEVLPPLFWPEDLGRFGDQLPHEGRARFVFAGRL